MTSLRIERFHEQHLESIKSSRQVFSKTASIRPQTARRAETDFLKTTLSQANSVDFSYFNDPNHVDGVAEGSLKNLIANASQLRKLAKTLANPEGKDLSALTKEAFGLVSSINNVLGSDNLKKLQDYAKSAISVLESGSDTSVLEKQLWDERAFVGDSFIELVKNRDIESLKRYEKGLEALSNFSLTNTGQNGELALKGINLNDTSLAAPIQSTLEVIDQLITKISDTYDGLAGPGKSGTFLKLATERFRENSEGDSVGRMETLALGAKASILFFAGTALLAHNESKNPAAFLSQPPSNPLDRSKVFGEEF